MIFYIMVYLNIEKIAYLEINLCGGSTIYR